MARVLVATMATADRSVDFEGMFEIVGLLERMEVDDVQSESSFGRTSCFYISTSTFRILCPTIFDDAVYKFPGKVTWPVVMNAAKRFRLNAMPASPRNTGYLMDIADTKRPC